MRLPGLFILILLATAPLRVGAQAGDTPGPGDHSFSSHEAIAQRLETVRRERSESPTDDDTARQRLLAQLEAALLQHREAVEYLSQVREEAESIRESLRSWRGLDSPPPYSIGFADGLRAQRQLLESELAATRSRLRIISHAVDEAGSRLDKHQRVFRRLREESETADSAGDRRAAAAAAEREELSSRIAAETLARLQLRRSSHEIQEVAQASAVELATLKLDAVRGRIEFTDRELDERLRRIESEQSEIVDALLRSGSDLTSEDHQVTWKLDILDIERGYWNALFAALNSAGEEDRGAAVQSLRSLKARIDDWVLLLRLQVREEVATDAPQVGARAPVADVRRVVELQNRLAFALEGLGDEGIRGPTVLDRVKSALLAFWGAELYLAEETASVAGEKVTTYRAVTLGKLLRLAAILVIGWFVLRFLSHRLHALLQKRPGMDRGRADTIRAWVFGLSLALLILYALNRVHIPFTAFAFLGGTLAIGIGFGAQTLLKNFISGVILSLERPFKVGDLVRVDDITGYIRRIGLRASVIQHFDGTDTLVPNSSLLENRVNNWTYGDAAARGQVEVGVAYGSPTRETARVLLAVADDHGLVLDRPEPTVQFKAFGDNALQFRLLYWYDAIHTRPESLASDLRFMIEKSLAEAGISIAFPQRDIHFDDSRPLRVELSRATSDPASGQSGG